VSYCKANELAAERLEAERWREEHPGCQRLDLDRIRVALSEAIPWARELERKLRRVASGSRRDG